MAPLQFLIDHALTKTPAERPVWIALSGGLDSCLLLALAAHAAHSHPRAIYALHVNHGLQAAASDFECHCRAFCSRLGVPLFVEHVHVEPAGKGIEAAAREARYAAFARRVKTGETLWLAQHGDDQAETLLLAALRGSGARGLAAMPFARVWQGRRLTRPLLGHTRADLEREAQSLVLHWVEDPSNRNTDLDRNFLRGRVIPLLASRWPDAPRALARSAQLAGEADALLDELAALDLAAVGGEPRRMLITALLALSEARQRLLVRYACQHLGLPTPPLRRLAALLSQLDSGDDAQVHVGWPGGEARCWRGGLYLQVPQAEPPADWQVKWDGKPGLTTPLGRVACRLACEGETRPRLRVTLRHGGESLRVAGRGRRDVKRLLQEANVPPWQRSRQLLVWHDDMLIAVLGVALAEGWSQLGPAFDDG